jgi:hypothetical protein
MSSLGRRLDQITVLVLVLAGVVLGIAIEDSSALAVVQLALLAAAVLVALHIAGLSRQRSIIVAVGTLLAQLLAILGQVVGSDRLSDASVAMLGMALAVVAPVLVMVGLRRNTLRIDRQTVAGALSIYLLIGLLFAALIGLIDAYTTGPLFKGIDPSTGSDRLYFSFVTLATVGYGDLVPATRPMRATAVALAIAGQLYLVSVVALVVSNIGRAPRSAE